MSQKHRHKNIRQNNRRKHDINTCPKNNDIKTYDDKIEKKLFIARIADMLGKHI
jgi:hypothetical protein